MSATSQSAGTGSLYQFFAPGGVLAKTHPAYEFRRGQLQMAEAVQQALNDRRHLIVEAGTGTGKTLAYLLPILRSGKRVIVSTGTKNLQEQLYYKDIPFLSQHMPELKVCYMKGRNNYLCRKKLYDLADQPVLSGLDEIDQYDAIVEWDKTTQTGDRAELAVLPESSLLWPKLDARNDTCIGQKCQQWERCFITEMHRKAMESDVIIVNHHLFFADLAIKMAADGAPDAGILPEAAAVVFDEAHELEDVAGGYFGVSISTARFEEVVRDAEHMLDREKILSASLQQALESLRERAQFFFAQLPQGPGGRAESRFPFERRAEFLEENGDGYISLQRAITRVATELQAMANKPEELHNMVRRCEELRAHLGFILESKDRNTVFWIERRGGVARVSDPRGHGPQTRATQTRATQFPGRQHVYLQATPIDVSEILRHSLFEQYQTIVLTSATLAVGGGFAYLKQRLGLENARELIVPPHFDYEQQALLYIPPDLPDPREPQFAPRAADRIRRILEISRGRAFC
ncbi:MAG TPA: DEAD/DEAH box helicase, partial [Terriglobales bacterium]|nr:DEAD/DEAH box helicase [Terriglobales bacterium]